MREVLAALTEHLQKEGTAAFCQLVDTRGSTPQKPGAVMLVLPSGQQVGTLGGGCVEAEVKRQALELLSLGAGTVVDFVLDHDYGWDDGLICGGRMEVLIEPLRPDSDLTFFHRLSETLHSNAGGTIAILSRPLEGGKAARYFAVHLRAADGSLIASYGDENLVREMEPVVSQNLRDLRQRPEPYKVQGVTFLPILPRCELLVVGGGHIGQAVARLASSVDFDVTVVDDRPEVISEERFPTAMRRFAGQLGEILPQLPLRDGAFGLVVTRGHNHDELALYHLIQRPLAYLGMIGSKRKIKLIFEDLVEKGISQERLDAVRAPVGLDIGSRSVEEIAISIVAQLIAHRSRATPPRPLPALSPESSSS